MLFYEWGWYKKGLVLNKFYRYIEVWTVLINITDSYVCICEWKEIYLQLQIWPGFYQILWPEYQNTLNNSTLCQHYMFEILCLHFNILKARGHSRKDNNTNLIDALNTLCMVVAITCSQEQGGEKKMRGIKLCFWFC